MMNALDQFSIYNKINALKHELEINLTKHEEIAASLKRIYGELTELSLQAPLAQTPGAAGGDTKVYQEPGNPDSQTPLEKIGDGG